MIDVSEFGGRKESDKKTKVDLSAFGARRDDTELKNDPLNPNEDKRNIEKGVLQKDY
jgi:hypothetical protein